MANCNKKRKIKLRRLQTVLLIKFKRNVFAIIYIGCVEVKIWEYHCRGFS